MKKIKILLLFICLMLSLSAVSFVYAEENNASLQNNVEWIDIVFSEDNVYIEKDLPNGVKGMTYPIPNCVAIDNNGSELKNLQFFVKDPSGKLLAITGNRFQTNETGLYTIVYSVQYNSLSCVKNVLVNVVEEYDNIAYEFNCNIPSNVFTSENVVLFNGSLSGGVGQIVIDSKVVYNDSEDVTIQNYGGFPFFNANKTGKYEVICNLKDFVNNEVTFSKEIIAEKPEKPILDDVVIPKKVNVGKTINLPICSAKLVDNNDKSYLVPVKVYLDDEEITSGMSFVANEKGIHTVKYEAININNAEKTTKTYSIEVLDFDENLDYCLTTEKPSDWETNYKYYFEQNTARVGAYNRINGSTAPAWTENKYYKYNAYIDNFISSNNAYFSYNDFGNLVMSVNSGESGYIEFSNKIPNDFIQFAININSEKNNFSSIVVDIYDSVRNNEKIELKIKESSLKNKTDIYLNDEFLNTIDYSFITSNSSSLNLQLDCKNNILIFQNDEVLGSVNTYFNGMPFLGFSSKNTFIRFGIENAIGENELLIDSIANNNISNSSSDDYSPIFSSNVDLIINCDINETLELKPARFFDLTDEEVNVRLDIRDSKGRLLLTNSGNSIARFNVEEYGDYSVTYTATDGNGNKKTAYGTIYVIDRIAPSIKIEGDFKSSYSLNETITLPSVNVSDNFTTQDALKTYCYVIHNDLTSTLILDDTFTFSKKGKYTFRFTVVDKDMNFVYVEYITNCR